MPWRRRISPFLQPLYRVYSRFSRGMTLGVRGVVLNAAGEVLLVEHTYMKGWHLPGGGVERGETAEEAIVRELVEEAGVQALERPRLQGVHVNRPLRRGDHVLVYRVDKWAPCEATSWGEIRAVGWFALDRLPEETTAGTRRRLEELFGEAAPSAHW